jgi:hypothetical protein
MADDTKATFLLAIRSSPDLPAEAKSNEVEVRGLEISSFDRTYMEFLDSQIDVCPRGPEWNEILKSRREALETYCDRELIDGRIVAGNTSYWVKVDPVSHKVVYWEHDTSL